MRVLDPVEHDEDRLHGADGVGRRGDRVQHRFELGVLHGCRDRYDPLVGDARREAVQLGVGHELHRHVRRVRRETHRFERPAGAALRLGEEHFFDAPLAALERLADGVAAGDDACGVGHELVRESGSRGVGN